MTVSRNLPDNVAARLKSLRTSDPALFSRACIFLDEEVVALSTVTKLDAVAAGFSLDGVRRRIALLTERIEAAFDGADLDRIVQLDADAAFRNELGDLLALERIEETLIEAAATAGVRIERRLDADILAVLGLARLDPDDGADQAAAMPIAEDRFGDDCEATAYHEAGHFIVGLLHGRRAERILLATSEERQTIGRIGGVVVFSQPDLDPVMDAEIFLAGDFAAGIPLRCRIRPTDAELIPLIDEARAGRFVPGDRARLLASLAALHSEDAAVLSAFRKAEERTLAILDRRDVRIAVRTVASALMTSGILTGEEATAIASEFIEPAPAAPNGDSQ